MEEHSVLYQGVASAMPNEVEDSTGFSLWGKAGGKQIAVPQGLKPIHFALFVARLKSCPDTKHLFSNSM